MKRASLFFGWSLFAIAAACADDEAELDETDGTTGTDSDGGTTSTSTSTTTTTSTTSTTDPSGADTGYDPPEAECGNGFVEAGEECDDGNLADGDDCSAACQIRCGLGWEAFELPPTTDSILDPIDVVTTGDAVIVAAQLQENTADQTGTISYGPFEGWLASFATDGQSQWAVRVEADFDDFIVAAIAADDAGDVYLTGTVDNAAGGTDVWIGKFSGADGSELWTPVVFDAPVAESADVAEGIAIAPDGDVVVSARVRAADGDNDVWVRKMAASDGSEVWTSTWSGEGTTFSTDKSGPVVVASDGTVFVLALEYEAFDADTPTLLAFPAAGGDATETPLPDLPGGQQAYTLFGARIDANDDLYLLYTQDGSASRTYFLDKLASDATSIWRKTQDDFARMGSDWAVLGVSLTSAGEPIVVGDLTNDYEVPEESWSQIWVARLDADGEEQCFIQQTSTLEGLSPADLYGPEVAASTDAFVSGNQTQDGDDSLWLGRFRAP